MLNEKEFEYYIKHLQRGKEIYYAYKDFPKFISIMKKYLENNAPDEILVVPFYINSDATYELYRYELDLRESIEDNEKINKEYLYTYGNSKKRYMEILRNYFPVLIKNEYFVGEITQQFGELNMDNVYFAIY